MNQVNFSPANLILLLLAAYVLTFFVFLARKASYTPGVPVHANRRRHRWGVIIGGYTAWVAFLSLLSANGFFDVESMPPRFALIFSAIVIVSGVLVSFSVNHRLSFLKSVPLHWLLYFQGFRVVVEIALWLLHREGLVPREMTFEGRNFDILVGLAAFPAGYLVQKKGILKAGIAFNIFGLLALVNIVTIVVFAFPSPFQVYDKLYLASYFPGLLIPALLAPVATYVHILSLKQLLHRQRAAKGSVPVSDKAAVSF